jgi:predicted DNA-binding protein YlxM (UPF0122 family)
MRGNYEIEKLFNQDVRDKKVTARGVHGQASKRGFVGKVYTPSDFLDGRSKKGRIYRGTGKVEVWNMYEQIIPFEKFQELDDEKQKEILTKYQDKYTVDEICDAWGLKNQYHYYKIAKGLNLPPRKKKLFKKTKQKTKEQKSGEQTSETSEKTMTPIQNALSINLDGTYQAEEASKYLEKLAFLLADMQGREVEIKLSIQHKL